MGLEFVSRTDNVSDEQWNALVALDDKISACKKCDLCSQRNKIVLGEGPMDAPIVLIGEAPGKEEDASGKPFCGPSGKKLDKALKAAGLDRSRCFVCNILKCRPEKNATPTKWEQNQCLPFLKEQLGLLIPRVVVHLGRVSTDAFHRKGWAKAGIQSLAAMQGRIRTIQIGKREIPSVTTYHPSYFLHLESRENRQRELADKTKFLETIKLAMELAGE